MLYLSMEGREEGEGKEEREAGKTKESKWTTNMGLQEKDYVVREGREMW